ncbi:MAG TPA: aldose epimerase family protein [Gillisia sp.]|nr:aldose epimerase family protein [Gillisia sp.]
MKHLQKKVFGQTEDGNDIEQYTLTNSNGLQVDLITYGARIISLRVPDKEGEFSNVVLGFDSAANYLKENPYFGAVVGRFANRIANGQFTLEGVTYSLARNNGSNNLHGGIRGFDKALWKAEVIAEEKNSLRLHYLSKHMEEGFPGDLSCYVTYTLRENNTLEVLFDATTNKTTIVNLTQHSYFNLSGDFNSTILDHQVVINADSYLPVNSNIIPTGEIGLVEASAFEFREPIAIRRNIGAKDPQLELARGYDHCWILNGGGELKFAASAYHPESGRMLRVHTTEPGLQFYTGNFLDNTLPIPGGKGTFGKHSGLCFETQHYPDSPNRPEFPSVILQPGEKYQSRTTFEFSVK